MSDVDGNFGAGGVAKEKDLLFLLFRLCFLSMLHTLDLMGLCSPLWSLRPIQCWMRINITNYPFAYSNNSDVQFNLINSEQHLAIIICEWNSYQFVLASGNELLSETVTFF